MISICAFSIADFIRWLPEFHTEYNQFEIIYYWNEIPDPLWSWSFINTRISKPENLSQLMEKTEVIRNHCIFSNTPAVQKK